MVSGESKSIVDSSTLLYFYLVGSAGKALEEERDTPRARVLQAIRLHEHLWLGHHNDVHQPNRRHAQLGSKESTESEQRKQTGARRV